MLSLFNLYVKDIVFILSFLVIIYDLNVFQFLYNVNNILAMIFTAYCKNMCNVFSHQGISVIILVYANFY